MFQRKNRARNEIEQDAREAETLGPAPARSTRRTPPWVWAWMLPLLLLVFLFMTRSILGPFVIAAVLAYIFSMVVDRIQARLRWPRALTVSLLYVIVLSAIGLLLYFGAETVYQQTHDFVAGGSNITEQGLRQIMGDQSYTFAGMTFDAKSLAEKANVAATEYFGKGAAGDVLNVARTVGTRLLDTLLVIIVSFYLLMSGKQMAAYMLRFVPAASRMRTGYVAGRIHTVLGAYLRGQLLLILLMSVVSFLVLQFVFNVPYAIPLAILTGFLEILPLIGPAIATVLAAGVALAAHGTGAAEGVIVAYFVLRELEDNLVMPFVVGRAVELHPLVTIFAVLAGGQIAGIIGMLLAVPVTAAIKVILDFLYPADPDHAMEQARRGLDVAEKEAEERGEEPAGAVAGGE
jgi:predicted PurR-regulated permease PerM